MSLQAIKKLDDTQNKIALASLYIRDQGCFSFHLAAKVNILSLYYNL